MANSTTDFNRRDITLRTNKVGEVVPEYFGSSYPNLVKFLEYYYDFMDSDATYNFSKEVKDLYRNRDIEAASLTNLNQLIYEIGNELTSGDLFGNPRKAAKRLAKFYRKKGNSESIKEFFRLFYGEEIEIEYGKDKVFKVGEETSTIGADSLKFLHNNALYQLYSVLVKSGLTTSQWKEAYKKFVHPAGWYYAGELQAIGTADVTDDAMPLSIADSDAGELNMIGAASMALQAPFTAMTFLFDSSGDTIRTDIEGIQSTLNTYGSLDLSAIERLGYPSIKSMISPHSVKFDNTVDSNGSGGGIDSSNTIDFSNAIETMDEARFRDSV